MAFTDSKSPNHQFVRCALLHNPNLHLRSQWCAIVIQSLRERYSFGTACENFSLMALRNIANRAQRTYNPTPGIVLADFALPRKVRRIAKSRFASFYLSGASIDSGIENIMAEEQNKPLIVTSRGAEVSNE